MNRTLAEWLTRPTVARVVVAIAVIVGLAAGVVSARVDHDDDVLAFLPEDDADVRAFRAINRSFGGLDVAIVGIEADNPLDPELFGKLRDLTKTLNDAAEVKFALSLANVNDFQPSPDGGIEADLLVRDVPDSREGQRALKQKVMSRDLIVGQLIAPGGKATIIYAFAAFGADPRAFAAKVKSEVLQRFPSRSVYLGGAPFVSTYIYDSTQADLRSLTPWAVAVIVLLVFAAFNDVRGVVLALLATTFGIVVALALMVLTGHRYNIVLSSMPVILFSVGSAYGIHVLARYYALAADRPPREALVDALTEVGPTVIAAGGTTMVGLLSFLTMDIAPLRSFGLFTAAGIGAALLSSLTFVPAAVVVFNIRGRTPSNAFGLLTRWTQGLAAYRGPAFAVVIACTAAGAYATTQVDTRMDQSAFFSFDSPPARADRFARRHFGGAVFIQVHATADFSSPGVLRAWTRLADEVSTLSHVSSVQHIGQVVAQLNAALAGARRIPDTDAQVKLLYRFLAGDAAVEQLVTGDRKQSIMHIKVSTADLDELDQTLAAIERLTADSLPRRLRTVTVEAAPARAWLSSFLLGRIDAITRGADVPQGAAQLERLRAELAKAPPPSQAADVRADLSSFLASPEAMVDLSSDQAQRDAIVAALMQPTEESQ
ncbi:MAG: MMPL family transporter, partial [Myxococcota bacterium]